MVSEFDLGWLTGIIDGEGNYTVRLLKSQTKNLGFRVRFQPQLVICNTIKNMILRISKIYDGLGIKHTIFKRQPKMPNSKLQWYIIIYSTGLRILVPHIYGKSEKDNEIRILKKFLDCGYRGGRTPYTEQELRDKQKLREELIDLHGNQAKKLTKNHAYAYIVSDDKIKEYNDKITEKIAESNRIKWKKG